MIGDMESPVSQVQFARAVNDAKWEALNQICNICLCVLNAAGAATQGFMGNAFEWHLKAQLASVELVRLYPYILQDVDAATLIELGLVPVPDDEPADPQ
jgi:hypothetical protein